MKTKKSNKLKRTAGICEWGNVKTEGTKGLKSKPEKIVFKGLLGADSILCDQFQGSERPSRRELSAKITWGEGADRAGLA